MCASIKKIGTSASTDLTHKRVQHFAVGTGASLRRQGTRIQLTSIRGLVGPDLYQLSYVLKT